MKRKILAVILGVTMIAGIMTGCSGKGGNEATAEETGQESNAEAEVAPEATEPEAEQAVADSEKQYKFGFTEMSAGSFFDACFEGLSSVIEANGDEVIHVEGKADSSYQLGVIEDFIAQGVDAVFYNPSDAAASSAAVKMLNEAGIPIINFDSAVSDLSKVDCFVVTDSYSAGQIAGEALVKNHPDGGQVAVLDFPASAAAADRAKGFVDTVTKAGFEVVTQMDAGAKPETGLAITEDILQAHPDLLAVFAINDECAQGAYSAITAAGEKVEIYSVNGGPEAKAAIKKDGEAGIWKVTAAQRPIEIGKQSAEVAYKILKGEEHEAEILIPSFAIDASNIEEYGKTDWQ